MTVETDDTQPGSIDPRSREVLELPDIDVTSYELGAELGHGGMGKVLAARDRRLKRMLAIKVSRSADQGALARFAREALLTARLQHPAIVPIHEAGRLPSGEPFYAMKLVAGRSLEQLVAAARDLDERLALLPKVIAVVDALAYAHAQRVIHRDLKPNNVIAGDYGETIVIDWGLAKELGAPDDASPYRARQTPDMTVEGQAMGTPSYMPPEQAAGESVDQRADVYGLGALLYYVLCGAAPYDGKTADAVIAQVLSGPPRSLAERQAGIPRDLLAIVDKAMAREPADRYADAGALADDLGRFYRGQLVAAHRYTTAELVRRWLRRHRAVVSVVAAAAVAVLIIAFIAVSRISSSAAIADQRDHDARRISAESFGRDELVAGFPSRALEHLAEAYRLGDDSAAMRVMLGDVARRAATYHLDTGKARVVELSRDGHRLLAVGSHATLWDIRAGKMIADLGPAEDATFAPDDKLVAVVEASALHLWSDGRDLGAIAGDRLDHVGFAPDGKRVATTGDDGTCMFEVATRARLWCIPGAAQMRRAVFTPDGTRVATADGARKTIVADAATGTIAWHADADEEWDASFEPAGTLVTGGDRGLVVRWASDGTRAATLNNDYPAAARVATNGTTVVWCSVDEPDAHLSIHGTPFVLHAATAAVAAVGFAGDYAVTVARDGAVRLWDARTAGLVLSLEGGLLAEALSVAADGSTLAVSSADGVRVWDVRALLLPVIRESSGYAAVSGDGGRFLVPGADRTSVVEVGTGRDVAALPTAAKGGALSHDGRLALTAGTEASPVEIWDVATQRRLGRIPLADPLLIGGFTPAGVVWTLTRHGMQRWTPQGEPIATLPGTESGAAPPVTSGDGTRFALPLGRTHLGIYDTAAARRLADLDLDRGYVQGIALNHDASRAIVMFAVAPSNNVLTAALWDTTTNHELQRLGADIEVVAFGSDDAFIAGYRDGTVRIWDRDAKPLALLHGHGRQLTSVALSRDHALAVTAADDGSVRIWGATTGHLLGELDLHVDRVQVTLAADDRHVIASTDKAVWWWTIPFEQRSPEDLAH
jgi:WD40 repeat protein